MMIKKLTQKLNKDFREYYKQYRKYKRINFFVTYIQPCLLIFFAVFVDVLIVRHLSIREEYRFICLFFLVSLLVLSVGVGAISNKIVGKKRDFTIIELAKEEIRLTSNSPVFIKFHCNIFAKIYFSYPILKSSLYRKEILEERLGIYRTLQENLNTFYRGDDSWLDSAILILLNLKYFDEKDKAYYKTLFLEDRDEGYV